MRGIGIEVSKARLDVAVHGEQKQCGFANTAAGHRKLVAWLKRWPVQAVVLEASGGYERAIAQTLAQAAFPVCRINPRQGRDFAKATGQLAKTDALDARVLAHMAQVMSLTSLVFMAVPILAPTLGQAIILVASWRWIFGALTIAAIAVLSARYRHLLQRSPAT